MKFRFKEDTPAGRCILYSQIMVPILYFIEQRKQEAEKIRVKYPERIPVSWFFLTILLD
jgi:hypothetical protein